MLCDETENLGRMEALLMATTLLRSGGVTVWSVWQNAAQLQIYGSQANRFPIPISNSGIQEPAQEFEGDHMDFLTAIWDFVSQHFGLIFSILLIVGLAIKLIGGDHSDPSARADGYGPVKDKAELARTDAINDVRNRYSKHFPGRKP
ncbi:MAG TPA: TraM recognition domain-containing protein [Candidatus Eremiobacteraceae bacterium]|nr:TraM recognition domain-containing protein [Candidatus Eremiobacteraceae bacterium]